MSNERIHIKFEYSRDTSQDSKQDNLNHLADIVDSHFSMDFYKIFKSRKLGRYNYAKLFLFFFLIFIYVIGVILLSQIISLLPTTINESTIGESVAILTAIVATFVALISYLVSILDITKITDAAEIIVRYNYEFIRQKENISTEDLPWLKALITLKNKQPDYKLTELFFSIDELTKEQLRGVLYGLT